MAKKLYFYQVYFEWRGDCNRLPNSLKIKYL